MLTLRFNNLAVTCVRHLYSASSLGIDGFISSKNKIKNQFQDIEDKFKLKMKDFTKPDSSNMIFTEDLKHMIHLAEENDDDLNLVKDMALKFSKQNKELRFGSFVFGPVIMRMYHYLNKPVEALEAFKLLENDGFFDQLISYQILMDLLFKNDMHHEVIEVFDIVKRKQLKGAKYPKNTVVLALGACYKLNTSESYDYAKRLWSDLNEVGHYPMRRAGTFAAALAIQQNEPHVALEILTSMKTQSYVTIRNLKVSALADLGRPDDALPLLRTPLDYDKNTENKNTFCEEVISNLKGAVDKFGRPEITQEFERIEKQLRNFGHISNISLSSLLCSEIKTTQSMVNSTLGNKFTNKKQNKYTIRPGLQDML